MQLFPGVLILTLLGASVQTGTKQRETREVNDSGLSCQQILKMGLDRFVEVYEKKHPSGATYVTRKAFGIYTDCKEKENDARIGSIPQQTRDLVTGLKQSLADLEVSALNMERALSGGGTIYADLAAGQAAGRADHCGKLIGMLSKPAQPDAAARAKAAKAMRRAETIAPKLEAHKNGFDTKFQWSQYNRGLEKWKTALAQMGRLLARMPDEAAGATAEVVEETVKDLEKTK